MPGATFSGALMLSVTGMVSGELDPRAAVMVTDPVYVPGSNAPGVTKRVMTSVPLFVVAPLGTLTDSQVPLGGVVTDAEAKKGRLPDPEVMVTGVGAGAAVP